MALQRDKITANAEKLVAKGKFDQAIKEYERLLEESPNDVNTLNRIGDLWVRIERNDEAVKVYRKIADHYARDGFFLKAIAIFKKINKLDPSKLDIYAKLAELYAKQGLAMEAKSQYMVLADYYIKHADVESAIGIYHKIAELDPQSVNVHIKLADLYSQHNQTAEALREYDRVGRMLLKRGLAAEAVQVFRKALKIDAGSVDLAESLVDALIEEADYDNAVQIVQTALESNRENPKLIALQGRIQLAKGDLVGARITLEQGLRSNPSDSTIREALTGVHLRNEDFDRALELIQPMVAVGETRAAIDLLNRVLKARPDHAGALEVLASAWRREGDDAHTNSTLSRLAKVHLDSQDYERAEPVLRELMARDSTNPHHREQLEGLLRDTGQASMESPAAVPPPEPPPAVAPPQDEQPEFLTRPAVDVPAPAPLPDEEIELEIDFAEEALEVDLPEPQPTAKKLSPAVDLMDEAEREARDLATEHVTEAEVFAKYGLTEKAVEHLQAALELVPEFAPAYERLLTIYMNEGDATLVRETANAFVGILREKGEIEKADRVEQDVWSRGFSTDTPAPGAPPPAPPVEAAEEDEESVEIPADIDEAFSGITSELHPAEVAPAAEEEAPAEEPEVEVEFDLDAFEDVPVAETAAEPLPEETIPPVPQPEPETFFTYESEAAIEEPADLEEESAYSEGTPSIEDLGELDFYIEQELFDEAGNKLRAMIAQYPQSPELQIRSARLDAGRSRAASPPPPQIILDTSSSPPEPPSLSAGEIDKELHFTFPEEEVAAPPPPQPPAAPVDEEDLFAAEDNFFDLASELEDELEEDTQEEAPPIDDEQSLEQIFREFKKGVEQQLDSEDYDTHYNLGIAYKEMGLIDEAIGEFQLASKDPKRAIDGCSMLGLCFLEKGMPQLAIKWYTKGLEMPEISDEEHLGLLYDLGSAYLEVGDTENAHKAFVEVYGINSKYRDVVNRIKQLEEVRRVQ
jgi:tetratricopeptide (TPR) repeat protein